MLSRRVIACLDISNGRVVKGTKFLDLKDNGDPVELAKRYEQQGADELVILDITATLENRSTFFDVVEEIADHIFIPLVVGGGITSVEDISNSIRSGADKVGINSAAIANPEIISLAANRFGSQCVVASIDAKRTGDTWLVNSRSGTKGTELNAITWAKECANLGAGEILLTSIDKDGTRSGYDIELYKAVREVVDIPLIASGGAGKIEDIVNVLKETDVDAALIAGILHDEIITIQKIKEELANNNIYVRKTI